MKCIRHSHKSDFQYWKEGVVAVDAVIRAYDGVWTVWIMREIQSEASIISAVFMQFSQLLASYSEWQTF